MSLGDELSKLAELRSSGSLTEEEFVRAKERLLHPGQTAPADPVLSAVNSFKIGRAHV